MNPYIILGALIALLISGGGGYWKGHHDAALACEVDKAAMLKASQDFKDKEAKKATTASVVLETHNAEAKVIYQTITKTVDHLVEKPVYRNVCLDDVGVRLANAALAGKAPDSGQPDSAVPKPEPTW